MIIVQRGGERNVVLIFNKICHSRIKVQNLLFGEKIYSTNQSVKFTIPFSSSTISGSGAQRKGTQEPSGHDDKEEKTTLDC